MTKFINFIRDIYFTNGSFNRFRLGQTFFIFAVTFGLFMGDGIRRLLFLAAMCCLTKAQMQEKFYADWTKGQKSAAFLLALFCLWVFLVPLLFGIDPIIYRIERAERPIELFIIMWETLIFAKDLFFFKNIKNFAVFTCAAYSVLAIGQRFMLGFPINFGNWIMTGMAWRVGALLSGLLPWVFYAFLVERSRKLICFYSICIILTCITIFLSFYTTFWVVMAVQFIAVFLSAAVLYREKLKRLSVFIIICVCIMSCAVYGIASHYDNFRSGAGGLLSQFDQLANLGGDFDPTKFTNRRYEIWQRSVSLIKERPMLGYGWTEGNMIMIKKNVHHCHNAFLQAAWNAGIPAAVMYAALLIILGLSSIRTLAKNKNIMPVQFVVLLSLLTYVVCGLVEDMFRSKRPIMALYLSAFMLILTPLAEVVHLDGAPECFKSKERVSKS